MPAGSLHFATDNCFDAAGAGFFIKLECAENITDIANCRKDSAAAAADPSPSRRQAPSRIEYSLYIRKCTNPAAAIRHPALPAAAKAATGIQPRHSRPPNVIPVPIVIPAQAGINCRRAANTDGTKRHLTIGGKAAAFRTGILYPRHSRACRGNPSAIMRKHYRQPFGRLSRKRQFDLRAAKPPLSGRQSRR